MSSNILFCYGIFELWDFIFIFILFYLFFLFLNNEKIYNTLHDIIS